MQSDNYNILDNFMIQQGIKTESLRKLFTEKVEIKEYSKNEIIFSESKRNNIEYILLKGVLHRFNLNEKGDIVTLRFYMGANIVTPHLFRTINDKSISSLEALTDCVIAEISVSELNNLSLNNPEFNSFRHRIIENEFSYNLFNEIAIRSLRAKERLLLLRKNYRNIENLIPHHAIASYLGITNVSLSRLRASEKNFV